MFGNRLYIEILQLHLSSGQGLLQLEFVVDKEEYAYLPDVVVVYTFAPSMDDTAAVDRR
tara:strand:- start:265 stop:441 length:177 start_codon:yes stop_codon:yes gene_type:complete